MAVELTAFAFIAAALVLVPAPWFWRTRNFAILFLIVWLFALNLIAAINAVIWAGNTRPISVVWCDIGERTVYLEGMFFFGSPFLGGGSYEADHRRVRRHTGVLPVYVHPLGEAVFLPARQAHGV
jgi:hypothetical protein